MELTAADLQRLEELAREATPGPWAVDRDDATAIRDAEDGRLCNFIHIRGRFGAKGRRDPNQVDATANMVAALSPQVVLSLIERARKGK